MAQHQRPILPAYSVRTMLSFWPIQSFHPNRAGKNGQTICFAEVAAIGGRLSVVPDVGLRGGSRLILGSNELTGGGGMWPTRLLPPPGPSCPKYMRLRRLPRAGPWF